MSQLDISGGTLPSGEQFRLQSEDSPPGPNSNGSTTYTPSGGGYMITSFFDIFTEISLDGGVTWTPGSTDFDINLTSVPEPGSLALLAMGAGGLLVRHRRRTARSAASPA